jgi:hypothetical protein
MADPTSRAMTDYVWEIGNLSSAPEQLRDQMTTRAVTPRSTEPSRL